MEHSELGGGFTNVHQRAERPRFELSLLGGVALVVGLVAVSVWAFTGSNEAVINMAGERVSPSAAYNPVAAGEDLPDGFRQLLPRDAINPIYEPSFVNAASVTWPPDAQVIGIVSGDEAKAYPVSFLNSREMVIDQLDGIPLLVSW